MLVKKKNSVTSILDASFYKYILIIPSVLPSKDETAKTTLNSLDMTIEI